MVRGMSWCHAVAMGLVMVLGVPSGATAQSPEVNPEEAYQAETEIQIEGATPWGAALISGGRELLVAERRLKQISFSILDAATGREARRLQSREVFFLPHWDVCANGKRLALGIVEAGQLFLVVIDIETDREIRRFSISQRGGLHGVAISPDGERVAAIGSSLPTAVSVWDIRSGEQLQELSVTGATSVDISPDGTRVLTAISMPKGLFAGGSDAIAEVWDVATGRRVTEVRVKDAGFNGAIFSPDGAQFLTANRGAANSQSQAESVATLWDAITGRYVRAIGPGEGAASGLSFSADGTRIVTASSGGIVTVWDTAKGNRIAALAAHGSAGGAYVPMEMTPGAFVQIPSERYPGVIAMFGFDGTSLVSSGFDGMVKVWVDAAEKRAADQSALTANLAAAQGGDPEAMHRLASAYRDGRGVARNDTLATQWLTQAADGGHGPANLELANALLSGDAGRQDCVAGGERLRTSIASGSAEATARLDAVLSPLGGREGAAALAPQIQADLLEAQIIEVLTRQDYPAFLANLCALEALGHADRLPIEARRELVYHRAAGLRAAGKPRAALAALNQYLNEAGNTGASYMAAIQMLRPLQEEAK